MDKSHGKFTDRNIESSNLSHTKKQLHFDFTALINNTRTLKLKAQPTKAFFAAVNQVFGGSSQLTTAAELYSLSELCTAI